MKANSAFLFFMTALVSAVLLIPSYTCAATYQWDDARSPFQEPITEIKKMHPATVKVFLPDHINAHDNIPLTIDTVLTHGNYFEGKIYLNTESEWGVYRFRSPSKEGGRVRILLKARDLKPGLNIIMKPELEGG